MENTKSWFLRWLCGKENTLAELSSFGENLKKNGEKNKSIRCSRLIVSTIRHQSGECLKTFFHPHEGGSRKYRTPLRNSSRPFSFTINIDLVYFYFSLAISKKKKKSTNPFSFFPSQFYTQTPPHQKKRKKKCV